MSRRCRAGSRRDARPSRRILTDVFNPAALARTLESLAGRCDGVAVVALDHQSVRAAIDDLVAAGTYVVTLVSDVPELASPSLRRHRQRRRRAHRWLADRALRPDGAGKIGVIAGSQSLRDHAERIFGFNQVMSLEFPHLACSVRLREAITTM